MFEQTVGSTALTTGYADSCFRIRGESYRGDVSFLATLRALVAPRMKEDSGEMALAFMRSSRSSDYLTENGRSRSVNVVYPDYLDSRRNTIVLHDLHATRDSCMAWMEMLEEEFAKAKPGWTRVEKVTNFFRKSFYVLCFIHEEMQNVMLFVERLDLPKLHFLQSGIFAFLPWFFDPSEGVSEDEMSLIRSLSEKTPDRYMECVEKIAQQYDFRSKAIRAMLGEFETKYHRDEIERVKADIGSFRREINELNNRIGQYIGSIRDSEIRLLGLKDAVAQKKDSELMEYFLCNKKIDLQYAADNHIGFIVSDYITYFDEDMAESVIDNRRSYVYVNDYRDHDELVPDEDVYMFMRAVFIDQTMKIKFCAAYDINLQGSVEAENGYDFPQQYDQFMPNPHINSYGCMGDYSRTINELLSQQNYIAAIEQCVASCKSLNFGDSIVMERFMRNIYGSEHSCPHCIELPDGRSVDFKAAIEWLKEQGANNE